MTAPVAIIMGSQSDWAAMRHAAETLDELRVTYEARIVSAHRTPERLYAFARGAKVAGFKVIIAGAGGAAHLPGMAAALTPLPVLGVPMESAVLKGVDSLHSIVQMPAGIPVGTLAIGRAGAVNAALLAAAILALSDPKLAERLDAWRTRQTAVVAERPGDSPVTLLPPGSTIGILGGGQLGRMLALAAARLGLRCHIFAPEADSPAFEVSAGHTVAGYRDESALSDFATKVDAITYEFENVPVDAVRFLEALKPVRPGSRALDIAQDRLKEKRLARDLGVMTADFAGVASRAELGQRIVELGLPAILKTTRFGYDGKGQAKILKIGDADYAYAAMNGAPAILESLVDFQAELSVVAARGLDGGFVPYDVVENVHRNHILHTSTVPARIAPNVAAEAIAIARLLAEALDYAGVLGVEFFLKGDALYVNEIAPRVHNSGHWTLDACVVSQFEQHIRAVAGWPLGDPRRHSDAVMTNLIGDEADAWQALAAEPQAALHLYGKREARPGRKMGHINRFTPRQG